MSVRRPLPLALAVALTIGSRFTLALLHSRSAYSPPPPPPGLVYLPVPDPTLPFWLAPEEGTDVDPNRLARYGSEGALTEDADVCIIGSGITGVGAAFHLSTLLSQRRHESERRQTVSAVILEAREFCSGATGRNGGHLVAAKYEDFSYLAHHHGQNDALRALAIEQHVVDSILGVLDQADAADEVDLVSGGRTHLYLTAAEAATARADIQAAEAAGADLSQVQWLDSQELGARYGIPVNLAAAATHFPGHNLWPMKLVTRLFELANSSSALPRFELNLHTRTPVKTIAPLASDQQVQDTLFPRRWELDTHRGKVKCAYVLHATNGYAAHLVPEMHGPTGIVPTRAQIIALRADASLDEVTTSGWVSSDEYWFPRPVRLGTNGSTCNSRGTDPCGGEDGHSAGSPHPDLSSLGAQHPFQKSAQLPLSRNVSESSHPLVILGGARSSVGPPYEQYTLDDSVVEPRISEALRDYLPGLFPDKYAPGREPEREWTGIMGYTASGDPFVGPIIRNGSTDPARGQYIAAGYTGHGMPRAFGCAEAVAGMIVSDMFKSEWEVPEWLPLHYLTTAGVGANRSESAA